VAETASALASFAGDPQGLVTACRRIVSRQPGSGPLVWLTARALCAGDPFAELRQAAAEIEADRTDAELAHAIGDGATVCVLGWPELVAQALVRRGDLEVLVVDVGGEGSSLVAQLDRADVDAVDVRRDGLGAAAAASDLVLVEAAAIGPTDALALRGSRAAAAVARHSDIDVWLVGGIGRLLPQRMWDGLIDRLGGDDPWERDVDVVPLDLVDRVVGPRGVQSVAEALQHAACPDAPELFRDVVL
jgi:hypothetical protein